MKTLRHFIVRVEKRFEDTIEIGGQEFYLDPKFNEFKHRIAYGEIKTAPMRGEHGAKPGDTLFFHHHVIMNVHMSMGGGDYLCEYEPDSYHSPQHAIAYRSKETGEIHMLNDWVFVEPVSGPTGDILSDNGIVLEVSTERIRKDVARVIVPNEELKSMGVSVGDIVGFDKNSDYKIKLDDGTVAYRMKADDISYVEES